MLIHLRLRSGLCSLVALYRREEIASRAASLSFYTLLSIFPITFWILTAMRRFFSPQVLYENIRIFLRDILLNPSPFLDEQVKHFVMNLPGFKLWGWIILFFSAGLLYVQLEHAVYKLLRISGKRHFIATRIFFIFWLIGMVLILSAPLFLELINQGFAILGWHIPYFDLILYHVSFMLVGFLVFCLILFILVMHHLEVRRVLLGGLFFTLTLQAGKMGLHWFVQRSMGLYDLMYGSLSSLIVALVWIYYFYNVFLYFVYWSGHVRSEPPLSHAVL